MTRVPDDAKSGSLIAGIVDSDGHFFETDEALYPYFDSMKYTQNNLRRYYLFPDLDGHRRQGRGGERFGDSAEGWIKFMDESGISKTVLYPTAALGMAFGEDIDWAVDLARAYNDFMADQYLKVSDRIQAVALLPVQDPKAAADELQRAVGELGLVGGMLPTPGLSRPYGDPAFDVLFERAEQLGAMLAVHGASFRNIGLDFKASSHGGSGRASFRLAHPGQPLTQMVQFISMICEQVFVRFPNLKVAFLEASCGWVPYWVERIDTSAGRPLAEDQITNSPIYFHAELNHIEGIRTFIAKFVDDRLMYASDYPHENDEEIIETLQEFLARQDIEERTKEKILRDNIHALYSW